jgi:hypothetical protein
MYTAGDTDPAWATVDLSAGSGMTATQLVIRALDGGSDDSFDVDVNGSTIFSYSDQYANETWVTHTIPISYTGNITVKITATAAKGPYWNPFGQVGIDYIELYGEETPEEPKEGCFIATAACGDGPALNTLRDFRDSYLNDDPAGTNFVSFYYSISPPIADFIDANPALKPAVRASLAPSVVVSNVANSTSTGQKIAVSGGMVVFLLITTVIIRRRIRNSGGI